MNLDNHLENPREKEKENGKKTMWTSWQDWHRKTQADDIFDTVRTTLIK